MHTPTRPSAQTHTHARVHTQKYVILIAFPRQQWFRERGSTLHYTYIASFISSHGGVRYPFRKCCLYKLCNTKFHQNLSNCSVVETYGRTEGPYPPYVRSSDTDRAKRARYNIAPWWWQQIRRLNSSTMISKLHNWTNKKFLPRQNVEHHGVLIKDAVWFVELCRRFGEWSCPLMVEHGEFSETSVYLYQDIRFHIPENSNLHTHHHVLRTVKQDGRGYTEFWNSTTETPTIMYWIWIVLKTEVQEPRWLSRYND